MKGSLYVLRRGLAQFLILEEINRALGHPFHIANVFQTVEEVPDDAVPVFVCCANTTLKAACYARLPGHGIPPSFIHPSATVASTAVIAPGTVVNMGATIQTLAQVGFGCMIHAQTDVAHNVKLSSFCNISPGSMISGHATIGWAATLWSGAVILPSVTVGDRAIIGANAVVRHDVPANEYWTGNPARRMARVKGGEA